MRRTKIVMLTVLCFITASTLLCGQGKYLGNAGQISFYSHTAIEDITADNNQVASVIDASSGEVAIIVVMTNFKFEKKLMEEHFNENYVESEKYPKATFNGTIINNSEVNYASRGTYPVRIEGEMKIHGVTNKIQVEGSIEVRDESLVAKSHFTLNPEDYQIKIPKVVRKNIAENLEISIEIKHQAI